MSSPFLTVEDKRYLRVTAALSALNNFGHIPPATLERKARIGTEAHAVIDAYLRGEFEPTTGENEGYVQSFFRWYGHIRPDVVENEKRYFDDTRMLTGCIDCLAKISGAKPVLIDWKTSAQPNPITWPLQAHLYYYLLREAGVDVDQRFLFIKLSREGALPKVFEYPFQQATLDYGLSLVDDFWRQQSNLVA